MSLRLPMGHFVRVVRFGDQPWWRPLQKVILERASEALSLGSTLYVERIVRALYRVSILSLMWFSGHFRMPARWVFGLKLEQIEIIDKKRYLLSFPVGS